MNAHWFAFAVRGSGLYFDALLAPDGKSALWRGGRELPQRLRARESKQQERPWRTRELARRASGRLASS